MAFQKEIPIYLQIRRSNLANIGINITDPFDYTQVVPFITCFINAVGDQYFKVCVEETTNSYNYTNPDCPSETVKIYYKVDEVSVGGASSYAPILYSSTKGLLAGSQEFLGFEQDLGCYPKGLAPTNPSDFKIVFQAYSKVDPDDDTKYIVYDLMSPKNPQPYVVSDTAPGYDAISFVADDPIDSVLNPVSTAPGYFTFRVYPEVDIQLVNP